MKPSALPTPAALARAFALVLRAELTPDELSEVIARNRTPAYAGNICASHDFRDANVFMAQAFESLTGHEMDVQDEAASEVWSEAWGIAKRAEFDPANLPTP